MLEKKMKNNEEVVHKKAKKKMPTHKFLSQINVFSVSRRHPTQALHFIVEGNIHPLYRRIIIIIFATDFTISKMSKEGMVLLKKVLDKQEKEESKTRRRRDLLLDCLMQCIPCEGNNMSVMQTQLL